MYGNVDIILYTLQVQSGIPDTVATHIPYHQKNNLILFPPLSAARINRLWALPAVNSFALRFALSIVIDPEGSTLNAATVPLTRRYGCRGCRLYFSRLLTFFLGLSFVHFLDFPPRRQYRTPDNRLLRIFDWSIVFCVQVIRRYGLRPAQRFLDFDWVT